MIARKLEEEQTTLEPQVDSEIQKFFSQKTGNLLTKAQLMSLLHHPLL